MILDWGKLEFPGNRNARPSSIARVPLLTLTYGVRNGVLNLKGRRTNREFPQSRGLLRVLRLEYYDDPGSEQRPAVNGKWTKPLWGLLRSSSKPEKIYRYWHILYHFCTLVLSGTANVVGIQKSKTVHFGRRSRACSQWWDSPRFSTQRNPAKVVEYSDVNVYIVAKILWAVNAW